MKTYFYDRTAYKLSEEPIPACFLQLDEHFAQSPAITDNAAHLAVLLAESICARMADVEMYAFLMEDARKRHVQDKGSEVKAAVLTRSFLFGYLGAGRALLDAGATTLALLYALPLRPAERIFRNSDFWHQLVTIQPGVHRRYHPLRLFFNELLRWCDETVLRIPPLTVSHSHFGPFSNREMHMRVLDEAELDLPQLTVEPLRVTWLDPLALHDRWQPKLLTLCEKLCYDLQACS
jgi:hypothetical protein